MCPFFVFVAFVVVFNVHIKHVFLQTVVDVGNVIDDDEMFVIVVAVVVIIFFVSDF